MALAGAKQTARILEARGGGGRRRAEAGGGGPGRAPSKKRRVRSGVIHQSPVYPSGPARPVTLTPPSGTNSQQLVRRWSVKSAPTLCIHIAMETDLHAVIQAFIHPPLQLWPAASTLVTPSCFDIVSEQFVPADRPISAYGFRPDEQFFSAYSTASR
ncbi:hypothetical protein D9C73_009292 [Collichthys lucidus]|uniref:Uncharacterized protein n=1 Tax=Collichthys lucidus TaxID=240159 RepID=A0A4U5ULG2_COLLU|nr:hypothetical protein D9C73_009292 [Collichthys lucidus]